MHRRSVPCWLSAFLILLLAGGSVSHASWAQHREDAGADSTTAVRIGESPQPGIEPGEEKNECRDDPGACIAGTVLSFLLRPFVDGLFTDIRGTVQLRTPLGVRLENRMRSIGQNSRSYPYVGIGVRVVRRSSQWQYPLGARDEPYLETAMGYQFALGSTLGTGGSLIQRSAVIGTEVQWLHGSGPDRYRFELAPGLEIERPSQQRLLLHLTLGVSGTVEGAVVAYPGLSVGYRW